MFTASFFLSFLPLALTVPAPSGSFTALTINVAGLPELLSSGNPEANTPEIGRRISKFDIVNAQEDFNYHAALYAADTHPYRTPTSGGAGIGSGLNSMSNFPYINLERIKWDKCYLNNGDCLTPKGFTSMRVRLDEGVYIDLYNLHTDAGSESGDIEARTSNINQVSTYMSTASLGNAVLLQGDTNSRYTRDTIKTFSAAPASLTDVWVEFIRSGSPPNLGDPALVCGIPANNTCEVVDKIFYRGNRYITFTATYYNNEYAAFLDSSGKMLSDHDPITATFSWSLAADISLSDLFGGPGGTWFRDLTSLPAAGSVLPRITSFTISGANRVDRIAYSLSNGANYTRGGTGGDPVTLILASDEYITKLAAHEGVYNDSKRIFWLEVTTSAGRTISAGTQTDDAATYAVPSGFKGAAGFYGSSGDGLDLVGVIWGKNF